MAKANMWGVVLAAGLGAGCVQGGTDGARSNYVNANVGSLSERRDALRTVAVVQSAPADMVSLGEISTDRCHRYFTEAQPSNEAVTADLKFSAYGQGADAIRIIKVENAPGLAANCWYILRATAEAYARSR